METLPVAQPKTYRRCLHEAAVANYGYVTTGMAKELGVPAEELCQLFRRGGLERIAYGAYRFADVPATMIDGYREAVLQVGADAFLYKDAVLDMHDLALVNPRRVRVGTPHRVRAKLPRHVQAVRVDVPLEDLTYYDGIRATTVARALLDCRNMVMPERLLEAAYEAAERGLLDDREAERVVGQLKWTR